MPLDEEIVKKISSAIQEKRFADAIAIIKPLLEKNPTNVSLLLDIGFAYANSAQYKDAITAYEKVIHQTPNNPSGYTGLGFVYRRQEDNENAVVQFRKALEHSPDNALVHFELGEALFDLDRYDEALKSYYEAIKWGGAENENTSLHRIAQVHLGMDNPDKAIEVASNLLNRDAGFISAYNIIGTASYLKENWKDAITAFEKYITKVPDDEAAQNLLFKAKENLKE